MSAAFRVPKNSDATDNCSATGICSRIRLRYPLELLRHGKVRDLFNLEAEFVPLLNHLGIGRAARYVARDDRQTLQPVGRLREVHPLKTRHNLELLQILHIRPKAGRQFAEAVGAFRQVLAHHQRASPRRRERDTRRPGDARDRRKGLLQFPYLRPRRLDRLAEVGRVPGDGNVDSACAVGFGHRSSPDTYIYLPSRSRS